MGAFNQEPVACPVGTETVMVREMPLPRVKRFTKVVFGLVNDYQGVLDDIRVAAATNTKITGADQWQTIIDLVLDKPYSVLEILIPDLPEAPFEDEDTGITLPQLMNLFETVIEVNKLGWIKKSLPFIQNMIRSTDLNEAMNFAQAKIVSMRGSSLEQESA